MADTLSNNFCSLCGLPFDRFGTCTTNIKTSLASQVVEQSGLLEMLDISISPMKKELVFICFSCRNVFSNYTAAKKEALKLLTEPVKKNEQLPFVPFLKRKLLSKNSEIPAKVQKFEACLESKSEGFTEREISEPAKDDDIDHSTGNNDHLPQPGVSRPSSKLHALRSDVVKLLEQGLYRSAIRKLWGTSKKFRTSLLSFLTNLIKKETKNLMNHNTVFTMQLEEADLDSFSWGPTISVMSKVAPTTLQVLYALLGLDFNVVSQDVKDAKQSFVGAMLSMALYKRYRGKASFIPLLHSLYLHNTGTPLKVNRTLYELGLTTPPCKLFEFLDQLSKSKKDSDTIAQWKKDVAATLEIVHRRPEKKFPADRRKKISVIPKATQVTTYSLGWDAIQYPSHSAKSKRKKPPLPLMAQAYAIKSRVPFAMIFKDWDVRLATNISFEEYVPDSEDFIRIREQMKIEIKKIIVKHMDAFSGIEVEEKHEYSELMAEKSHVVDLGSNFKCPTDNGTVATVLKNLKQYMVFDGEPVPLCVFGTPASVERMVGAKDVMSCFSEKVDRLDGLEPCVTDFGRQILIAQDIIKIFYPNGMSPENGNLHHLWSKYRPELKGESPDYKAINTFLEVVAHGHTVALTNKKIESMFPYVLKDKMMADSRLLEQVSEEVVSSIWPSVDTASLDIVRQGNEPVKDGECSFGDCVNFHDKARLPCSERCGRPFNFCCRKPLNDGLIECGRRENCPKGGWFHLNKKCSGLSDAPEDEWLCSTCLSKTELKDIMASPDLIWEYHRGLLWYCLFFTVAQSAEAQGNGWLLHAVWKVCMPLFESRGHVQYLQQGYSYLSAVAGRIPRMAAHDAVHNRTVNLKGGNNNNVSWDRAIEAFNQELLRKPPSEGNSREDPLASSRAIGAWLYHVNSSWEKKVCLKPDVKERDLKKTVEDYVKFVNSLDILQKVPGRLSYKDVEFAHNIFVKKPKEMVAMLKNMCEKDESRQLNERESDVIE
ncbi:uncharacterized protein [Macrobrachium rosenbergii]|uniref:uncharacterized protein isoform X1 n=2 Tax=Macrobrachium rosenbergii TaxID=79674 RepID=UPI0034D76544